MLVKSSDLKVGDVLRTCIFGTCLIVKFKPYTGPIDFVERIAIFSDRHGMSIEKDHWYEIVDVDGEGYRDGERTFPMQK